MLNTKGFHNAQVCEIEYDCDEEECKEFFMYSGERYNIEDFSAVRNRFWNPNPPAWQDGWDGYLNDTFFSAVVIKYRNDEEVIVALYM